jgi:GAF domain-containing protein
MATTAAKRSDITKTGPRSWTCQSCGVDLRSAARVAKHVCIPRYTQDLSDGARPEGVRFTDDERLILRMVAHQVWQQIAHDVMADGQTLTRDEVIEVVCDADRLATQVRSMLARRVGESGEEIYAVVRPAFPYAKY